MKMHINNNLENHFGHKTSSEIRLIENKEKYLYIYNRSTVRFKSWFDRNTKDFKFDT